MNCVEWEERVALHAGGDLADGEGAGVERHIAECPGCQMLWSGLREDLAALKTAHAEVPAAAHFAAVRSRVIAELERQARPWWKLNWTHGFAAAIAVLVALLAIWPRGGSVPAPRVAMRVPAPPPFATVTERRSPVERGSTLPHGRGSVIASAVRKRREPVTVKLQTTDPNIVIYWIAD